MNKLFNDALAKILNDKVLLFFFPNRLSSLLSLIGMESRKLISATDIQYSGSLLNSLNEQRGHGLFCDVTVIVEDRKFRAHRNILSASSMLNGGLQKDMYMLQSTRTSECDLIWKSVLQI